MKPLFIISSTFYEQPEFIQLRQLATSKQQANTATALWVRALACAARLQKAGIIAFSVEQPLTTHDFASWLDIARPARVAPILQLLSDCDLIKKSADQHYQICHWERYVVPPEIAANYHGWAKFRLPDEPLTPHTATAQPQLTQVTPLALQSYTPIQRQRLAASTKKVLTYLQQQSGKQFDATETVQILLADLFSQKVTMKQVKQVIDWKIKDWRDSDYWKFVRPQTLFGPKFKQYLLEAPPLPAAKAPITQSRTDYLRTLFNVCSGDVDLAIQRAADEAITTDHKEMEAIGHALGH
ncbi:conserved phage C-terminal domain-containing protein [Loigolactobacillus zhaoyuanensis]|uniref:Conserved phage C-terminal domain-containing protein n=1 Tax=Loigolactobacillus zhaoyuanensis TaxID=2486017 RepID=A0ABW8UCW8_9LACO|nr:conserved phage C-terminal domain-containing protein [Loigolactobacillus zhaoyuanensis]